MSKEIEVKLTFKDDKDYVEFWEYQKKGSPFKDDLSKRIESQLNLYSPGEWQVVIIDIRSEERQKNIFRNLMKNKKPISGLDPMYDEFPE